MDHPEEGGSGVKELKELMASVEALKRDLEELGVDAHVEISLQIPLEDLEREG